MHCNVEVSLQSAHNQLKVFFALKCSELAAAFANRLWCKAQLLVLQCASTPRPLLETDKHCFQYDRSSSLERVYLWTSVFDWYFLWLPFEDVFFFLLEWVKEGLARSLLDGAFVERCNQMRRHCGYSRRRGLGGYGAFSARVRLSVTVFSTSNKWPHPRQNFATQRASLFEFSCYAK